MARTPNIAIEIGRSRVRAIRAQFKRGRLTVRQVLAAPFPDDLNLETPKELGAWLGDQLRTAGVTRGRGRGRGRSRGRVVVTLGRGLVSMKRLTLPTGDAHELADMTALAMQRDLAIDAAAMILDFVPIGPPGGSQNSSTVLAVAAPRSLVDTMRQVVRSAGLDVHRIGLSALGAAALFAANDSGPGESVLIVDVGGESVELTLMNGGAVSVCRCGDVPAPGDPLAVAEAVLTESRRTWMTANLVDGGAAPDRVVLMGSRKVCEYAAGPVSEMLGKPATSLAEHPRVIGGDIELDGCWSLIGALLEHHPSLGGREILNLARPRRPPDTAAAKRRAWLMAAGFLVVAGLGLFTLARQNLRSLEQTARELTSAAAGGHVEYSRYSRDTYKLQHLRQWQSTHVDWLEHAEYLSRLSPPPDRIVLDSWTGTLDFNGVKYDRAPNKWSAPHHVTIVIDGEARDRETADAFREALVRNSVYTTSTTGADAKGGKRMQFGFTYRLRTAGELPRQNVQAETSSPTSEVASR
jgi:hypothetical protein